MIRKTLSKDHYINAFNNLYNELQRVTKDLEETNKQLGIYKAEYSRVFCENIRIESHNKELQLEIAKLKRNIIN